MKKPGDEIIVEKILIKAFSQADWSDPVVTKLVEEKLELIGIKIKSITVIRNIKNYFESCLVTIEPAKKHFIEKQTFPIKRWTMRCIM